MLATHISVERKFVSRGIEEILCNYGHLICFAAVFPFLSYSPHCQHVSCGKCPLFVDTSSSDKRLVAKAAKKAARSVLKAEGVIVDVTTLLNDPPPLKRHC